MERNTDQLKIKACKIMANIELINKNVFSGQSHKKEGCLLIGYTGGGKTSLFYHLTGVPLVGIEDIGAFGKLIINAEDPSQYNGISPGRESKTTEPTCNGIIWDCPGFGDARGEVQDISNIYSIYSLAKTLEKIKIVMVISQNTLEEDVSLKLLKLIKNVGKVFSNIEECPQSLCLVVTKGDGLNIDFLRNFFKRLRDQERETPLDPCQIKILDWLSAPQSNITFFNRPQNLGLLPTESRTSILTMLYRASWLEGPKVSIAVESESTLLLRELETMLIEDVFKFLVNEFSNKVVANCLTIVNSFRGPLSELRDIFLKLLNKLEALEKEPTKLEYTLQKIVNISNHLSDEDLKEYIMKKIRLLRFLGTLDPTSFEIHKDTKDWFSFLPSLKEKISQWTMHPIIENEPKTSLVIKGNVIGSQDINEMLTYLNQVCEVTVKTQNTVIIDQDILAHGINLTIYSPRIVVVNKHQINLRGRDALNHQNAKADNGEKFRTKNFLNEPEKKAPNGANGLKGLPGGNGGNFFAITDTFEGIESLTINVSGGDGGVGQDGGDGAQGNDGNDRGLEKVLKRDDSVLISRETVKCQDTFDYIEEGFKFVLTVNTKFEEIYKSFDEGQEGGDGGLGGEGGPGGEPGHVEITNQPLVNVIREVGRVGKLGNPGKPGQGGKHGPTYEGIYINEVVAATIRRRKKVGKDTVASLGGKGAGQVVGTIMIKQAVLDALKSVALGLTGAALIQGVCSGISSFVNSRWKKEPYKVEESSGKADDGRSPSRDNLAN